MSPEAAGRVPVYVRATSGVTVADGVGSRCCAAQQKAHTDPASHQLCDLQHDRLWD